MNRFKYYFTFYFTLTVYLIALPAFSADFSRDLRQGTPNPESSEDGYLELGFSIGGAFGYDEDANWVGAIPSIPLHAAWRYEKNHFFIEDLQVGYELSEGKHWALDFVPFTLIEGRPGEEGKYQERDPIILSGFRGTGYFGPMITQLQIAGDIVSGNQNGWAMVVRAGRHFQYRNWNYHGAVGTTYTDARLSRYFFGIDKQTHPDFPTYEGKSAFDFFAEFGGARPLSEHWVFSVRALQIYLDDAHSNSPILRGAKHISSLEMTFAYVF